MLERAWLSLRALLACTCTLMTSQQALGVDFVLSGFGTVGYAISDEKFRYLRYIDDDGTFKVDSLVGVQMEAQFSPQWGATFQVVASAPRSRDEGIEAKVRWAFLSYRPDNDWLLRVGRLRPPFLVHTQNAEIGVTYDQARLPVEFYSISPVYDVDGAAVTRTWSLDDAEINVDAYGGTSNVDNRLPVERVPGGRRAIGLEFDPYLSSRIAFAGIVVSHSTPTLLLRAGVHRARVKFNQQVPRTFEPTQIPGPVPVGGILWGEESTVDKFHINVLTLGVDWRVGDWRVTGEYGRRDVKDAEITVDSHSGYVTLARTVGRWTPYLTHARLLTGSRQRKLYDDVNSTPVPLAVQGPPFFLPATFHRTLADTFYTYDQYSNMFGVSYGFSATSKLKLEWMQTKVGLRSVLVDGDVHDKRFNVFTLAYSFAF